MFPALAPFAFIVGSFCSAQEVRVHLHLLSVCCGILSIFIIYLSHSPSSSVIFSSIYNPYNTLRDNLNHWGKCVVPGKST
jgi:hypothetical protein